MAERVIVIDADVISHFIYASKLSILPTIFPNEILLLDKVHSELQRFPGNQQLIDTFIKHTNVKLIPFPEDNDEIKKEYAFIKSLLFKGNGESACMAYARYKKNVIASSNLRDIGEYCKRHGIDHLTTLDFLYAALKKGIFTAQECDNFISRLLKKHCRIPVQKMNEYICPDLSFM